MAKQVKKFQWSKDRPVKPDVDPLLGDLQNLLSGDNRTPYALANASGLAPSTIANINKRVTRRPQGVTLQMLAASLGYDVVLKKRR